MGHRFWMGSWLEATRGWGAPPRLESLGYRLVGGRGATGGTPYGVGGYAPGGLPAPMGVTPVA
jgi:hypothetical protein